MSIVSPRHLANDAYVLPSPPIHCRELLNMNSDICTDEEHEIWEECIAQSSYISARYNHTPCQKRKDDEAHVSSL